MKKKRKNTEIKDADFILQMQKALNPNQLTKKITQKQAKEEAKRIVQTIVYKTGNYWKNKKSIKKTPIRITLLKDYECKNDWQISDEDAFSGNADLATAFKKGTVSFYLCRYLHGLGFTVSHMWAELKVFVDSGWNYK